MAGKGDNVLLTFPFNSVVGCPGLTCVLRYTHVFITSQTAYCREPKGLENFFFFLKSAFILTEAEPVTC